MESRNRGHGTGVEDLGDGHDPPLCPPLPTEIQALLGGGGSLAGCDWGVQLLCALGYVPSTEGCGLQPHG